MKMSTFLVSRPTLDVSAVFLALCSAGVMRVLLVALEILVHACMRNSVGGFAHAI